MSHFARFGFVALSISLSVACSPPDASVDEDADGVAESADALTLVNKQITDIGWFYPSSTRSVAYTGKRRYVGARVEAPAGARIQVRTHIEKGMVKPVAAITDDALHVLAREVGGTISGGPGHSVAYAQFVTLTAGTYWVLWGEDSRHHFTINATYEVKRNAGVACHHDNMCASESCKDGACATASPGGWPRGCIVGSDCTNGKCIDGLCEPSLDGEACTDANDCVHLGCAAGTCTCLPAGTPSSDAQMCCSQWVIAGSCN